MMELLNEQPDLITAVNPHGKTALHFAAANGRGQLVDLLLSIHPALIEAKTSMGWTAMHSAAERGRHMIVAQLLAADPRLILSVTTSNHTPLQFAASGCHQKLVELLLQISPLEMITQADDLGRTALHCVIEKSRERHSKQHEEAVFARLVAACPPQLIEARDREGMTVLHYAALGHRQNLLAQILAVRPELTDIVDNDGCNALHYAVGGKEKLIYEDGYFDHVDLLPGSNVECVEMLWQVNPRAGHVMNNHNYTPFEIVVAYHDTKLLEMFERNFSMDEIATAFIKNEDESYKARYKPIIRAQCESLLEALTQDVAPIVDQYLFGAGKKRTQQQRQQTDPFASPVAAHPKPKKEKVSSSMPPYLRSKYEHKNPFMNP